MWHLGSQAVCSSPEPLLSPQKTSAWRHSVLLTENPKTCDRAPPPSISSLRKLNTGFHEGMWGLETGALDLSLTIKGRMTSCRILYIASAYIGILYLGNLPWAETLASVSFQILWPGKTESVKLRFIKFLPWAQPWHLHDTPKYTDILVSDNKDVFNFLMCLKWTVSYLDFCFVLWVLNLLILANWKL